MSQLSNKTRTVVKEMDKKNDLTCIRVQSTKFEVNCFVRSTVSSTLFPVSASDSPR